VLHEQDNVCGISSKIRIGSQIHLCFSKFQVLLRAGRQIARMGDFEEFWRSFDGLGHDTAEAIERPIISICRSSLRLHAVAVCLTLRACRY